jgi:hypothetical protein
VNTRIATTVSRAPRIVELDLIADPDKLTKIV